MGYPKTISVTMQKHNALLVVQICIRGWVRFNKPKKKELQITALFAFLSSDRSPI